MEEHKSSSSPSGLPASLSRTRSFAPTEMSKSMKRLLSLKNVMEDVATAYEELQRGRFEGWTRYQLITILVKSGIELRGEKLIPKEVLYSLTDALFEGKEAPKKPALPSSLEADRMHTAAKKIQYRWIAHSRDRNCKQMLEYMQRDQFLNTFGIMPPEPSRPELLRAHRSTYLQKKEGARRDDALAEHWVAPSWEYAEIYESYNHPRRGGPGGEPYDYSNTTLGRFCVLGGCGEQCDLWDEGQVSALGYYGPGVTGYFKFLKWCTWIFALLAIVAFPQLVVNTYGSMTRNDAEKDFYTTTLGNLEELLNTTSVITLPYCGIIGLYGDYCRLDKEEIAVMYGRLDVLGVVLVVLGYLWLRWFENEEQALLDRNTITPSNYTVCVTGLPDEVTEEEIERHFLRLMNYKVVAVNFGYDSESQIKAYKTRGVLAKQLYEITERIKYLKTVYGFSEPDIAAKVEHLTKARQTLNKRIKRCDNHLHVKHILDEASPVCAFVTFDEQEAVVSSVLSYRMSLFRKCFIPKSHLLKGKRISVERAPEPSTIIWENLAYGPLQRARRIFTTIGFSTGFIILSVVVTLIANDFQQRLREEGGRGKCPSDWNSYNDEFKQDLVRQDESILHCYCNEIPLSEQVDNSLCRQYWELQVTSRTTMYVASAVVVLMNFGIGWLLRHMVVYEKHHSMNTQEASMFRRSFILKFINVGVVPLLMSSELLQSLLELDTGASRDFNEEWYRTSGVALMIVMILSIAQPHLPRLLMLWARNKKRQAAAVDQDLVVTQDQLNALHLGPDFLLSVRYAHIMVTFFVCWMYTSGMPLMPVIACASIWVSYLVDKWMFLNFYRAPPRFDTAIAKQATSMIPVAAILHLALAIWIYGNRSILSSDEFGKEEYETVQGDKEDYTLGERATQEHTFPLLVMLCVISTYTLLRAIKFKKWLAKLFRLVCCKKLKSNWKLLGWYENGIEVTYTRALERGLLKGLASYSILHNPKYQQAFNISDDFTVNHNRMSSLQNILMVPSRLKLVDQSRLLNAFDDTEEGDIEMQQPHMRPFIPSRRPSELVSVLSSADESTSSNSSSAPNTQTTQLLTLPAGQRL